MTEVRDWENHKIMSMEAQKRERVLNAAFRVFCKGYKAASTDEITREAGISKGLLFHYFGTKEQLYRFLVRYGFDTLTTEYYDVIGAGHRDLLVRLWDMILRKGELTYRYPAIFQFMLAAYLQARQDPEDQFAPLFRAAQEELWARVFQDFDRTLFREGIDPVQAANVVWLTLRGYADTVVAEEKDMEDYQREWERYMADITDYFALFRRAFYHGGEGDPWLTSK